MLTTPFETVETSVTMRVSSEWAALLRALLTWILVGSLGVLAASGGGLMLRALRSGLPWLLIYLVLAALVGLVAFGSIRTQDAGLAIVLSGLIGVATLLPIGLGALALSFVLAIFGHQTVALALTVGSTLTALALMTGVGGILGALAGLFNGLHRLKRTPSGCTVVMVLLALALAALTTFGPSVAFGVFRPRQPFLEDVAIPVPYLAFAATLPASFDLDDDADDDAAHTPSPTPSPNPTSTPYRRTVDQTVMLWDVVSVEDMEAGNVQFTPPGAALDAVFDTAGYMHMAYITQGGEALHYAVRAPGATTWDVATAAVGTAIADVAIALDRKGYPHIAYTALLNPNTVTQTTTLQVAAWDVEQDAWISSPIDGAEGGSAPAPAFVDGVLHVAYFDGESGGLKLARYIKGRGNTDNTEETSGWQIETVETGEDTGQCPALAFDAEGLPHIAYVDGATDTLRYARYIPTAELTADDVKPTATMTPRLFETPIPEADGAAYTWQIETIGSWDVRCAVALALDAQTDTRHILFYEADNTRVYEALYAPDVGRWQFNRIGAARPLVGRAWAALSITLDVRGGVQMTFNGPTALRFVRETPGNVLQSAVVDGPSVAQQVLIDGALRSHVVYLFRGGVWDATLTRAPEHASPTPPVERPTIGPSATPYRTPTPTPIPLCGDGVCREEDAETCPDDCQGIGWICGNGMCEDGEDETICPADCKTAIEDLP